MFGYWNVLKLDFFVVDITEVDVFGARMFIKINFFHHFLDPIFDPSSLTQKP
jgi:hypothetical protein